MHKDATPHDRPPLDTDSIGYDGREHEHGQSAVPDPVLAAYDAALERLRVLPTTATTATEGM